MDLLDFGRCSLIALLAVGATAQASGQTVGKRVFSTSANCEMARVLTADECRNAHANAVAELDEKSPRFASRVDCEKTFNRCMIAGFAGKRIEFEPALRGFEINLRSATDKTVVPVVDGDSSALGFRARTLLRAAAGISNALRAQAQARWAQAQKARAAAAAASARAPAGDLDPSGGTQDGTVPNAPRGETSPPSASDLAAAARRREELRHAPTVY